MTVHINDLYCGFRFLIQPPPPLTHTEASCASSHQLKLKTVNIKIKKKKKPVQFSINTGFFSFTDNEP